MFFLSSKKVQKRAYVTRFNVKTLIYKGHKVSPSYDYTRCLSKCHFPKEIKREHNFVSTKLTQNSIFLKVFRSFSGEVKDTNNEMF